MLVGLCTRRSAHPSKTLPDMFVALCTYRSTHAIVCPASDFIPELNMHYREVRQAEWDGCSANKLHPVKPHLGYCSAHISLVVMLLF